MKDLKVSKRYAKAVMYLFNKSDDYIILKDNFNIFYSFIKKNINLFVFLKNPIINSSEKIKILELFFSINSFHYNFRNFIKFLIIKKRFELLFDIYDQLLDIINEKIGTIKLNLFSNVLLESELKNKLLIAMEDIFKKNILLNEIIDLNIIGGLKLSFRDIVLDGTINNSFFILKKKIINENFLEAAI